MKINWSDSLKNCYYHNITISGLPGCGSTTLLNGLRQELSKYGWRGFSGGEFMRLYATEKGLWDCSNDEHHNATVYSADFDREVDYGVREKLKSEKQWLIESWLSGFMAQNIPGVLKILMICSSDAIRIDRVVNRDQITVAQAKKNTLERYQKNLAKWSQMYHAEWQNWVVKTGKMSAKAEINFWAPELYDLVIDTYSQNQEQTLQSVWQKLRKIK